jgi:NAD(P)-dependent dehydrogenase (short-subunit alcohol dehydrogenase family)
MKFKVAVVTGAGRGIGRAVAQIFLRNNYNVVLTGRHEEPLKASFGECDVDPSRGLCVAADVGNREDVDRLFDLTLDKYGRVDVVFNNAGISAPPVEIDELDIDDWQAVINTNITGSFLCARKAFAIMKKQRPKGGRIINNGSISAYAPRPNSVPYTVSKHAISGLTRCLALDGRQHNIACGQIDIGNAHTEMAAPLGSGTMQANGAIVGEPLMDVDHVATSVLHMAELPLEANILFMNVMATKMPFVGRG